MRFDQVLRIEFEAGSEHEAAIKAEAVRKRAQHLGGDVVFSSLVDDAGFEVHSSLCEPQRVNA